MAEASAVQPSASTEQTQTTTEKVLYVSMNQDNSLFALGTSFGFHVFDTNPLKRRYHREFGSAVGIIELYRRSNISFIVGSPTASRFSPNKLTVWNDHDKRVVVDVDFHAPILAVRVCSEYVIVALQNSVDILRVADLSIVSHHEGY